MSIFENRSSRDTPEKVLLALIALAPGDCDAHRAVLQIVRPGLIALTKRATSWWGWEDASSAIIAAAVDRISRYPKYRARRVAANLLGDVWHSVWAQRKLELRRRAGCTDELLGLESAELVAACSELTHGDEVMALIEEAVRLQRISAYDGRLVALHRVAGY